MSSLIPGISFGRVAAGASLAGSLSRTFPRLEDEIIVTVTGSPQNNTRMSDLFQIAAAAAFGCVSNRAPFGILLSPGMILLEMDYAKSSLRFTLRYSTSLVSAQFDKIINGGNGLAQGVYKTLPVFGAVKDSVTGAPWNFTSALPGLPPAGASVPLKYAGRDILTRSVTYKDPVTGAEVPSPNPAPLIDDKSRSSMVNIIFAALSNPGTTQGMLYPPPTGEQVPPEATGGSQ